MIETAELEGDLNSKILESVHEVLKRRI